ncbi:oxaloacetate-decarboxylating malate dehydrogenase [Cyanobium sp. NIES-981]|uniref:oxaloacetate-decarboxylating malate dehydrogenase n=1 Tax=Cyanobium sp. NIES-981 TaxID=1851505 RepID=UPI0007DD931F|nr:oxaloacetate-decarboxylating malate dehydrogenase [Cyanobium sp. NIES-981]SBO42223.1 Malate oxidoreductase [Cyanobium sp. NIES-981]
MFFRIHHTLHYHYEKPVFLEPHTLRLTPRQSTSQRLLSHSLTVREPAAGSTAVEEPGGGDTTEIWFTGLRQELWIHTTAVVETLRDNPFAWILTDRAAQGLPLRYAPATAQALAPFLGDAEPSVAAWAAELAAEAGHLTTDLLLLMADRIHHTFDHVGRFDGEPLQPAETLAQRRGACRDTAMLYVAACRSLGLAARFVSGYSMHHPPEVSEHELHAWAEVWLPGGGWRAYDPSLGLAVADGHVTLVAAADHRLAAPVSGHYRGTGVGSHLHYRVRVEASPDGERFLRPHGSALLADPRHNRDTAFSPEERQRLGMEALLPAAVETLAQQVERVWQGFQALQGDQERFVYLDRLRRSNRTLFHAFLQQHIEAALPVVYTPTVGRVIQGYSHAHQPPDLGVFLTPEQEQRLPQLLRQAAEGPVELLLITDAEGILGLGDQGVGGIHICQGKLAVYTLCSGLHPSRALAVVLDVGTDNPQLLADPLYPGRRQPRLRGEAYDRFLDAVVAAAQQVFPGVFLHWEDFGKGQARRVLDRYRDRAPSFNDDIQGTSGVAAAAVLAACRGLGTGLSEQRIVIFGAGTAGCGIAERLLRLLQAAGLSPDQARQRLWALDRQGLIVAGQPGLTGAPAGLARPAGEADGYGRDGDGRIGLLEVVRQVRPTVLIGTSTVAGAFSQAVVETMAAGCPRPLILPLSNPTALAEATPADLLAWSGGRALVATGSPFAPVPWQGQERVIGQCNNCFLYPGLGFASVAVGASRVSEAMIDAALEALSAAIPAALDPDAPLMPALHQVRAVSRAVAEAVAITAVAEGLAGLATTPEEALRCLDRAQWQARYGDTPGAEGWGEGAGDSGVGGSRVSGG